MDVLKLEYVHDDHGHFVHIDLAQKGQNYFCPACKSQLFLKAGPVKARHFSHPKDAVCSTNTLKKILATHLITQAIQSNIDAIAPISLNRHCIRCDDHLTQLIPPGYISGYQLDYSSGDDHCDLVLHVEQKPTIAIQINFHDEIDLDKIWSFPLRWLEMKADEIILTPSTWTPILSSIKPVACHSCYPQIKTILIAAHAQGYDRSMFEPVARNYSDYLADTINCPHCQKDVIYFYWHGASRTDFHPPTPMPHTIQHLSLSAGGRGWTNTCSSCQSTIEHKHFYPPRVRSDLTIQEFVNHQLTNDPETKKPA